MNNKVFEFLNRPTTKLSRNGFDRSFRSVFSCKAGQAVPVCCVETVPDSHYEINPVDFLRTTSMNEANFVRMKQHLDFFFVPYSMLWRPWEQYYQQTSDPTTSLDNMYMNTLGEWIGNYEQPMYPIVPLVLGCMRAEAQKQGWLSSFDTYLGTLATWSTTEDAIMAMFLDSSESDGILKDIQGYDAYQGVIRLLDMLGYGNYLPFIKIQFANFLGSSTDPELVTYKYNFARWCLAYRDKKVNIWRLAAYQAVCENFYTNTHYVKPNVSSYNFDDVVGGSVPGSRSNAGVDLFMPHYVPWKFDLFTAALPSPQFGAVSLVNVVGTMTALDPSSTTANNNLHAAASGGKVFLSTNTGANSRNTDFSLNGLDVMDLKRAEALQAWKLAIGRAGYTTRARFDATFGTTPDFSPKIMPIRLGSLDGDILKDTITGTSGSEFAEHAATGSGSLNSRQITFNSKDFGVIIGIFRVLPVAEYDSFSIDSVNTKFEPFDYFTPKFQDLGLSVLPASQLSVFGTGIGGYNTALGYVPRNAEYKVGIDKVHGEFCQQPILFPERGTNVIIQSPVGEFAHFVSTRMDIETWQGDVKQYFVDPAVLDHIWLASVDNNQGTDQFHVNLYCDVKCIQPMSVLGLPQFNN